MSRIKCHYSMLSIAIATVFTVTTSGMATAAEQPIKIGLLEDASGNFALPVIPKIHATELAIDEINAKGGILGRKIDLIQYDTQSDNTRFQQMARRLIKNDNNGAVRNLRLLQPHIIEFYLLHAFSLCIRGFCFTLNAQTKTVQNAE